MINMKEKYFDFRQGNATLAPIIGFSNFLMLSYLTIKNIIPFYIFVPIFVVIVLTTYTAAGHYFRKHQYATDINIGFAKSTESAKTTYVMMMAQKVIMDKLQIPYPDSFEKRLDYMRQIGNGQT
jgi:hypothetical protein